MSSSGCAVTSCAMVARYFGSSKDPGGLCRALNSVGGFTSGGALYWQKVPTAAGGTIRYIARYDYCSLTRINQELDAGYPVIVKVYLHGYTHYVVITGRYGSTYYINDPAYGDRTTLNGRYGSPSAIHGFRVCHGTRRLRRSYTRYQQALAPYAGTGRSRRAAASGGGFRYADATGCSVTAFTGTYLAWITRRARLRGGLVTLDGRPPVLVDLPRSAPSGSRRCGLPARSRPGRTR
jgi:hypothetical protein